jgi:ADP-ribose pyrophosphatase YjhB (NUDIX family)
MSGMYRKCDIYDIMSNMTIEEINIIRDIYNGKKQWSECYQGFHYYLSLDRFYQIKNTLRSILYSTTQITKHEYTPWTFPKGRLEYKESPWECALREFEEESGINIYDSKGYLAQNEHFSENYISFDHEIYETNCWLFIIPDHIDLPHVQGDEIVERKWMTTEESLSILSETKKKMIINALPIVELNKNNIKIL